MSYFEQIKILVMDVDGTLTDGKIYMSDTGEIFKVFDVKDGYAIKEILPELGIIPVLLTARQSKILMNRCNELDIADLHQGIRNKIGKLEDILADLSKRDGFSYSLKNVAYIGDDNLDLQCMKPIKDAGGLVVCPANAAKAVIEIADFISTRNGGDGAVREFIEWLELMRSKTSPLINDIIPLSLAAYDFIMNFNPSINTDGKYDLGDGVYANVISYTTREVNLTCYETHQKYIDIQYIIYGSEIMMIESLDILKKYEDGRYDKKNDTAYYKYNSGKVSILQAGDSIILHPHDGHRGAIAVQEPVPVRKIVIKVPVK